MSQYLIDTNTCIAFLNQKNKSVVEKMSETKSSDIFLCRVIQAELYYGAYHSQKRESNLEKLENFFNEVNILDFNDVVAQTYGQIRHDLASVGTPIGSNDLFIAATALAHNVTLVTNNEREFSRIESLNIENWFK